MQFWAVPDQNWDSLCQFLSRHFGPNSQNVTVATLHPMSVKENSRNMAWNDTEYTVWCDIVNKLKRKTWERHIRMVPSDTTFLFSRLHWRAPTCMAFLTQSDTDCRRGSSHTVWHVCINAHSCISACGFEAVLQCIAYYMRLDSPEIRKRMVLTAVYWGSSTKLHILGCNTGRPFKM